MDGMLIMFNAHSTHFFGIILKKHDAAKNMS